MCRMRQLFLVMLLFTAGAMTAFSAIGAKGEDQNSASPQYVLQFNADGDSITTSVPLTREPTKLYAPDGRIMNDFRPEDIRRIQAALQEPEVADFLVAHQIDPDRALAAQLWDLLHPENLVPETARKPEAGPRLECLTITTQDENGNTIDTLDLETLVRSAFYFIDDSGEYPIRRIRWAPQDAVQIIRFLRDRDYEYLIPEVLAGLDVGVGPADPVDSRTAYTTLKIKEPLNPGCGECLWGVGCTVNNKADCCTGNEKKCLKCAVCGQLP